MGRVPRRDEKDLGVFTRWRVYGPHSQDCGRGVRGGVGPEETT